MQLHCLGTAGYHPNESRHTSCYFLPQSGIVLDAGSGLFRLPGLIQTDTLDIVLSHCHLDHVFGLTFLLDILFQRPVEEVRIWGKWEKIDAVKNHLFHDALFPVPLNAQWHPIDECKELQISDARVTWLEQEHPGGSVGYRLDWDQTGSDDAKSMLYLTDTVGELDEASTQWAHGADLMFHECNFRNDRKELAEKTGHAYGARVGEVAKRAAPKRLLIGHLNPLDDEPEIAEREVGAVFSGEILLAEDGLVVDF